MLEFLGENYYVDFESLELHVNIPRSSDEPIKKEEEETKWEDKFSQHISVVKFETIKMMLEVVLTEREEIDDNLGIRGSSRSLSIPFKVAFNTLLKHGIIKYI